jgi:hypothetical protein
MISESCGEEGNQHLRNTARLVCLCGRGKKHSHGVSGPYWNSEKVWINVMSPLGNRQRSLFLMNQ